MYWWLTAFNKLLRSCVGLVDVAAPDKLRRKKALLWLTGAFPRPGGPSEPTYIGVPLPFLSFLFYSLLILLYLFIPQTRPNQQHLNTTNANPGGLLQTRTQEVEDLVQPSNRGLLLQPSSRGLLLSAFVSGVFYGRQPIESGVFYRLE